MDRSSLDRKERAGNKPAARAVKLCCLVFLFLFLFAVRTPMRSVMGADQPNAGDVSLSARDADVSNAGSASLPSHYDARQIGKDPVIKSQGSLNTCWALTATSALEAAFLPRQRIIFSADHMSLHNGFSITQEEGGDYKMIMSYLTGWYGPVTEAEDPYGDGQTADGLSAAAHVKGIRLLQDCDRDTFKEQILTYGPVQTSLYMDRSLTGAGSLYYNADTYGYYDPYEQTVTHDVLILGWDDDYSADSFALRPSQNGAWICQNTWGEGFGDNGIFYVSYDDANITGQGLVYTRVEEADSSERIEQNDVCGWQARIGYGTESCYIAGVFQAGEGETLAGAGFYSLSETSDYTVYLVRDFQDASSFDRMQRILSGTVNGTGFHCVDLPDMEQMEDDTRFAVAVYLTSPGEDKPAAVEVRKDQYTDQVTTQGRETYLSLDGMTWENTQDQYEANICLKAYLKGGTG